MPKPGGVQTRHEVVRRRRGEAVPEAGARRRPGCTPGGATFVSRRSPLAPGVAPGRGPGRGAGCSIATGAARGAVSDRWRWWRGRWWRRAALPYTSEGPPFARRARTRTCAPAPHSPVRRRRGQEEIAPSSLASRPAVLAFQSIRPRRDHPNLEPGRPARSAPMRGHRRRGLARRPRGTRCRGHQLGRRAGRPVKEHACVAGPPLGPPPGGRKARAHDSQGVLPQGVTAWPRVPGSGTGRAHPPPGEHRHRGRGGPERRIRGGERNGGVPPDRWA